MLRVCLKSVCTGKLLLTLPSLPSLGLQDCWRARTLSSMLLSLVTLAALANSYCGPFPKIITSEGVESIVLARGWSKNPDKRKVHHDSETLIKSCTGSPFARSWSVFRPKPSDWEFVLDGSKELGLEPSAGFFEFTFLSNALSSAGLQPSKLRVGSIDISKDSARTMLRIRKRHPAAT